MNHITPGQPFSKVCFFFWQSLTEDTLWDIGWDEGLAVQLVWLTCITLSPISAKIFTVPLSLIFKVFFSLYSICEDLRISNSLVLRFSYTLEHWANQHKHCGACRVVPFGAGKEEVKSSFRLREKSKWPDSEWNCFWILNVFNFRTPAIVCLV